MRMCFDCNDYRNGMSQGFFEQVTFGEVALDGPRTVIRLLTPNTLRIGRRKFKHDGWSQWVGNWCWDEICIDEPKKLLAYLREKGFVCSRGPTKFYERFNAKTVSGGDT